MIKTPWGEQLNPDCVFQEYPRPQMARESYLNLNGLWEYAICKGTQEPARYDGEILVPFSPESLLSGVERMLHKEETLWYRRTFTLPEGFVPAQGRVLLHFGAVDQEAAVYCNGVKVASHLGGYTAFSAEITDALKEINTLVVRVRDDTDASWHSRGKQKTKRGGIWYTPQSGIWQTVWMEAMPKRHISGLRIVPRCESEEVEITVQAEEDLPCAVTLEGQTHRFDTNRPTRLPMKGFRFWSPEDPYLYSFSATLDIDEVKSYFGMRSVCVREDARGVKRLFLNGKPYFHNGLLDQGYWPDGLYTPPSDEAMVFDIQTAKDLGYNMLRKHIKIEPLRWYYHCDRLGVLVWQDMVNGGGLYCMPLTGSPLFTGLHFSDRLHWIFARKAKEGHAEYLREMEETVRQLGNAPSIVLWVPFNEGWGQFDAEKACERLRALDDSRPIDHASGWHDQHIGELKSLHVYFKPYRFHPDSMGRAVVLSEFGGYHLREKGHCYSEIEFGYRKMPDRAALWDAYQGLYEREILPVIPEGLCATVYTQLTDVEDELNGIMTYDRRVVKLPKAELRELNRRVQDASPKE